jgi:dihydroneopterin aldolase
MLEGMVFYGYHGVRNEERSLGQRFVIDLAVWKDLRAAGASDDLAQTVNYASLYHVVAGIVTGQPLNLIEAIAERIASAVLAQFPVEAVRVCVRKPDVPIPGVLEGAAVEIYRSQSR